VEPVLELAKQAALIVLDSFAAASGAIDENTTAARASIDELHKIAEVTGCVILVVHHSAKSRGKATGIDLREALRGSSAIFDAADTVLVCTLRDPNAGAEYVRVTNTKNRFGQRLPPVTVKLTKVDGTIDGERFLLVDDASLDAEAKKEQDRDLDQRVIAFIQEHRNCSKRDVREGVKGRARRVDDALDRLLIAGSIANAGSEGRPKFRSASRPRRSGLAKDGVNGALKT
jgi:RecA-family ATPase